MENLVSTNNLNTTNEQNFTRNFILNDLPFGVTQRNPVLERLADEGHRSFSNYIEWLGLGKDPNIIVLSSSHHYYYDAEELNEIKTVLNLKQLNHIKQVRNFLNTVSHILSPKTYFLGSFTDRKYQYGFLPSTNTQQLQYAGAVDQVENGIASRIPLINLMYNIMDSRTIRNMTKKNVSQLLEESGLRVLDMTEINGLTCFCSQKMKASSVYE